MIVALTALLALASPSSTLPIVAVIPLDAASEREVAARALFLTVEGAVPEAAAARGLGQRRFALVSPIDEAARACTDDRCRRAQAKRLGARYALVLDARALKGGALTLTLLDVDAAPRDGPAPHRLTLRGTSPFLLAQAGVAVTSLLEEVAPRLVFRRADALARLRQARSDGDDAGAARICFELAAMVPAEMAAWTFDGADLLAEAGQREEAAAIFSQLALDDSLDEEVRIEALARSRVPEG